MSNVDEMLNQLMWVIIFELSRLGKCLLPSGTRNGIARESIIFEWIRPVLFHNNVIGIVAAPGTFQEIIVKVLEGTGKIGTIVYLDDIFLFTKSIEEQYQTIEEVLKMINSAK